MRYDVIKHAQPLYFHLRQKTVLAETAVDLILHEKTHNQELAICVTINLQQRKYTKNFHSTSVVWKSICVVNRSLDAIFDVYTCSWCSR